MQPGPSCPRRGDPWEASLSDECLQQWHFAVSECHVSPRQGSLWVGPHSYMAKSTPTYTHTNTYLPPLLPQNGPSAPKSTVRDRFLGCRPCPSPDLPLLRGRALFNQLPQRRDSAPPNSQPGSAGTSRSSLCAAQGPPEAPAHKPQELSREGTLKRALLAHPTGTARQLSS